MCFTSFFACNSDCECPDWYEGDKCKRETREKFLGTYSGTDCITGNNVTITAENEIGQFRGDASMLKNDDGIQFSLIEKNKAESDLYILPVPWIIPDEDGNPIALVEYVNAVLIFNPASNEYTMVYNYYIEDGAGGFILYCSSIFLKNP
jgi:hypothetical protein